jgi:hypothetical protein
MDYSTPRFESSVVATACQMAASTFRGHFRRGNFRMLGNAKPAEGDGLPNLFSLGDVMGFAVASALMRAGVEPKAAFKAGVIHFANTGDEDRMPGQTFNLREHGFTMMAVHASTGSARIFPADEGSSLMDALFNPETGANDATTIILVNDVERYAFNALGMLPELIRASNQP